MLTKRIAGITEYYANGTQEVGVDKNGTDISVVTERTVEEMI